MPNSNNKKCFNNSDCGENKMCIFDYEVCKNSIKCQNICIDKKEYYNNPKCIDNNKYNELNSSNINKNINLNNKEDCISWAKKQECTKNNSCNSIIYRHKKQSFLDNFKGIANIFTNNTKHNIETDNHKKLKLHQEQYIKNGYDKKSNLHYSYNCSNNGGNYKKENIPLNSDIDINCPVNKNDETFKNVCAVLDINNKHIKPYHNLNCDFNVHNNHNLPKSQIELDKYNNQKIESHKQNKKDILYKIANLKKEYNLSKNELIEKFDNIQIITDQNKILENSHSDCYWDISGDKLLFYASDKCDINTINTMIQNQNNQKITYDSNITELNDIITDSKNSHNNSRNTVKQNLLNLNEKIRTEIENEKKNENMFLYIVKYLLIIFTILFIITIIYFFLTIKTVNK